jgi:O-antigen/teichoic acid export membrane protein
MSHSLQPLGLRHLGINIISTLSRQFVTVALGLGLSIFLARILGPEQNGIYNLAILLPLLASKFLDLGVPSANAYFLGRGDISLRIAMRTTLRLWFILSVLGMALSVLVIWEWGQRLFPNVPMSLLWLAIMLFPVILAQVFFSSLLRGIQDFQRYNRILLVGPLVTLITSVILIWVLKLEVIGALLALLLGTLIQVILAYFNISQQHKHSELKQSISNYAKASIGYGWKVQLSTVISFINYRIDLLLVNFLLNPLAAGIYIVSVQLAERLWMLSQAVDIVILPRLSALHDDEASRLRLTPLVARWVFILSFIGAFILAILGLPFIRIVYGSEYVGAYRALLWLLPGIVLISGTRVLANDISARGRPELNMYTAWLILIINIVANLLLIPHFGIEGAAIASTIAYTANSFAKLVQYSSLSQTAWWVSFWPNDDDRRLIIQAASIFRRKIAISRR